MKASVRFLSMFLALLATGVVYAQSPFNQSTKNLLMYNGATSPSDKYVAWSVASGLSASYNLIFPNTAPAVNQVLQIASIATNDYTMQWATPVTGSGTATQVAFWSSTSGLSGNANLYWDNTNSRLGVGQGTPTQRLDVNGNALIELGSQLQLQNPAGTKASTFAAGAQTAVFNYTLPTSLPTANQALTVSSVSGTDPATITLDWVTPGSGTNWLLAGNATASAWNGTTGNFLGTSTTQPLVIATTNTGTAQPIEFFVNNTEKMRIRGADGYVTMGSSFTPSAPLHVKNANSAHAVLYLQNTSTDGYSSVDFENDAGTIGNVGVSNSAVVSPWPNQFYFNISAGSTLPMTFNQQTVEKMAIDLNGNFYVVNDQGIGFTSSTYASIGYPLDIRGSTAGTIDLARLQNNQAAANNNAAEMLFAANRTTGGLTNIAGIAGRITDITNAAYKGALIFSTANNAAPAERMRILYNGNVGIGATAPTNLLELGSAGTQSTLGLAGTTSGLITITTNGNAGTWTWTLPTDDGTSGQFLQTNGSGVTSWQTASASTLPMSGLTAASASNSIDNANNAQTWQWNTLGSNSGLTLSSTSTAAASSTQTILNISTTGANTTAGQTTYGLKVANTHSTNTSTNVGASFSASGGATANYAIIVPAGSVGIGNSAPTQPLDVTGNVRFSAALMPNNAAGTSGQPLVSQGAGTAPIWQDYPVIAKVKAADEGRTNTTTFTDDADMASISIGANESWTIHGWLRVGSTSATPDFKWRLSGSNNWASIDMMYSYQLTAAAPTTNMTYISSAAASTVTPAAILLAAGVDQYVFFDGSVTWGGTGGTLAIQWAQNTSNGTATTLKRGSYISLTKSQ